MYKFFSVIIKKVASAFVEEPFVEVTMETLLLIFPFLVGIFVHVLLK